MNIYGYKADGTELKTQWQAIKDFGFTRLSAIVKSIEKHTGIVLKRRDIKVKTRYGGTTWITEYWYENNQN